MHANDVTGSVGDALWDLRQRIKRETDDGTIRTIAEETGVEPHVLHKVLAPGSIKAIESVEKKLNERKDSMK
mgnify:CR=1 FL=1